MNPNRLARLFNLLLENQLDALALNPGATLEYLTGLHFHRMERPVILLMVPPGKTAIILPELELLKLQTIKELPYFAYNDDPNTWNAAFQKAFQHLNIDGKIIGIEPTSMRYLELDHLQLASPLASFTSAAPVLDRLRIQKDEHEIAAMRQAVTIAQNALLATLPQVKPGITERELAAELTIQLLRAGSGSIPFDPIVSGGPNSANPHASPSDRQLIPGDLLLFDWGASYHGYCSDLTRTFAVGKPDPEYEHIALIVKNANSAACTAAYPGIHAGQLDSAARRVIDSSGYGPYFTHRVGHGLGMEPHEPPYLHAENRIDLQPGMTFTIEPGIYLPGRYGVRIEDNLVITDSGAECLSDLPRDLIQLG